MKIMNFLIICILLFGCNTSKENAENLSNVQVGMHMRVVNSIMNFKRMNWVSKYDGDSIITTLYRAPVGASSDFAIIYSRKDSLVEQINYGD